MRIVSRLLPQRFRHQLRRSFDSLYSKPLPDKETIGVLSQWTIVRNGMGPDAVVYSGGVGEDITFEQELIRRFGVKIHVFDPSPVAARTIALANTDHLLFKPVGLSASVDGHFTIGGGPTRVPGSRLAEAEDYPVPALRVRWRRMGTILLTC